MHDDTDGPADERCDACGHLDPLNCPCDPPVRRFDVYVSATLVYEVSAEDADDARALVEDNLGGLTPADVYDGPDVVRVEGVAR